jgi:hypothetical protein
MLTLFVYGFTLYADERFVQAVKRDWSLLAAGTALSSLFLLTAAVTGVLATWMNSSGSLEYYAFWIMYGINTWCWTLSVLYIGIRHLDFTNKWLLYGRDTVLPFYLFHHPAIITIAFFVVQWDLGIALKLPLVALGSLLATLGLVQVIKRIQVLRALLGVKGLRRDMPSKGSGRTI